MANQHPHFTPAEVTYLRTHYATGTQADIQTAMPGRLWSNIGNKASRIGCSGRPRTMPTTHVSSWHETNLAILRTHYPVSGAALVAELTGLTVDAVRAAASRHHVAYVAQGRTTRRAHRPYVPRPPKVAVKMAAVKQARAPRPLPPVKAPRASTPVKNAAMSRKRVAAGKPTGMAEAIARHKTLRYGQPEHTAFLHGGLAGLNQWKATQA